MYLRQLAVAPPQAAEALLEEGVDLRLLDGGGQVHGLQRASVIIAPRPGEGEGHHGGLLPLGQEVEERQPHGPVLDRCGRGKDTWRPIQVNKESLTVTDLTRRRVLRGVLCPKRLGVFAGSLLLGIDGCVIPKQEVQLQNKTPGSQMKK